MPFCESCGVDGGGNYCPACGQVRSFAAMEAKAHASAAPQVIMMAPVQHRRYGGPAVLSALLPGLGQLIKGQPFKGAAFFFGWAVGLMLIIPAIIVWAWGIRDAYVAEEK